MVSVSSTVSGSTPASYAYRPDGLRYSKTTGSASSAVTHKHLWDGQNIVAEMGVTGTVNTRYIRGVNLIARKIDSNHQYYLFDGHGDVLHIADSSGNILLNYRYDGFGNQLSFVETDTNPFRYCGEYFDRETGTYYLRARNYNPFTGRFTTEDAVRSATVSLVGKSFVEPISLNLYLYCKHNPVNLFDPSGNYPTEADVVGWVFRDYLNSMNNVIQEFWYDFRQILEPIENSFKAVKDSAYLKGGIGFGLGIDLSASKEFSLSAYEKVDLWAFNWDSSGFERVSVQEAAVGGDVFNLLHFGELGYSYEREGWFDVTNPALVPFLYEGEWDDKGNPRYYNNLAYGMGAYMGIGASFEFGFDLNRFTNDLKDAWFN